jgi:hypothetical protein
VFYGRADENLGVSGRPTDNPPYFLRSINMGDQIHTLIRLSEGIPAGILNPDHIVNANVNYWPIYMPLPYTLEWNFNVQRELGRGFTAQLGYVGSGSHDLYVESNFNQPQPGPGAIEPREPFPAYSAINSYLPLDRSNYNSLIFQIERRFHNGFSFLGAYTWSHSLDYGGQVADSNEIPPQNPDNYTANYGNSNFDVRQRLSVSYIYELPFGRGKTWLTQPGVARASLGGWQLSGVTSIQTGLPFTPILNFDPTNTGTTARPNVVAGAAFYPTESRPERLVQFIGLREPGGLHLRKCGAQYSGRPSRVFCPRRRSSFSFARSTAFNSSASHLRSAMLIPGVSRSPFTAAVISARESNIHFFNASRSIGIALPFFAGIACSVLPERIS